MNQSLSISIQNTINDKQEKPFYWYKLSQKYKKGKREIHLFDIHEEDFKKFNCNTDRSDNERKALWESRKVDGKSPSFRCKKIDKNEQSKMINEREYIKKIANYITMTHDIEESSFFNKIYDFRIYKNYYLIVSDYGTKTLADQIKENKSQFTNGLDNELKVFSTFYFVALGIFQIHKSTNNAHYNLKPSNIIFSGVQLIPKVADIAFGAHSYSTLVDYNINDADFLAPEVFEGSKSGVKADMWSLGMLLLLLTQGNTPFEDVTVLNKWSKMIPLAGLNIKTQNLQLQRLIRSLIKPAYHERISMAELFKHPWICKMKEIWIKEISKGKNNSQLKQYIQNFESGINKGEDNSSFDSNSFLGSIASSQEIIEDSKLGARQVRSNISSQQSLPESNKKTPTVFYNDSFKKIKKKASIFEPTPERSNIEKKISFERKITLDTQSKYLDKSDLENEKIDDQDPENGKNYIKTLMDRQERNDEKQPKSLVRSNFNKHLDILEKNYVFSSGNEVMTKEDIKIINEHKLIVKKFRNAKNIDDWTVGDYKRFRALLMKPMIRKFKNFVKEYNGLNQSGNQLNDPSKRNDIQEGTMISWNDWSKTYNLGTRQKKFEKVNHSEIENSNNVSRNEEQPSMNEFNYMEAKNESFQNQKYNDYDNEKRYTITGNINTYGRNLTGHSHSSSFRSEKDMKDHLLYSDQQNQFLNRANVQKEIEDTRKAIDTMDAYNPKLKQVLKKELDYLNNDIGFKKEIDQLQMKVKNIPQKDKSKFGGRIKDRINKAFNMQKEKSEDLDNYRNENMPIPLKLYTFKENDKKGKKLPSDKIGVKEQWGDRLICCGKNNRQGKLSESQKHQVDLWNKLSKENKQVKNPFKAIFWRTMQNNMQNKYESKKAKIVENKKDKKQNK